MQRENQLPVESIVYVHIDDELVVGPHNQNADMGIDEHSNFIVNGIPRSISEYIMFQVDENADVQDALQVGLIAGVLGMTTPENVTVEVIPYLISAEHPKQALDVAREANGYDEETEGFEGYEQV